MDKKSRPYMAMEPLAFIPFLTLFISIYFIESTILVSERNGDIKMMTGLAVNV
jgi:hypothetical protein